MFFSREVFQAVFGQHGQQREVFQAVFGQHGQQHLAVAEFKHSSVPIILSRAPPFVFGQPTARHTSM